MKKVENNRKRVINTYVDFKLNDKKNFIGSDRTIRGMFLMGLIFGLLVFLIFVSNVTKAETSVTGIHRQANSHANYFYKCDGLATDYLDRSTKKIEFEDDDRKIWISSETVHSFFTGDDGVRIDDILNRIWYYRDWSDLNEFYLDDDRFELKNEIDIFRGWYLC